MARVLLWGHSRLETFLPGVLRFGIPLEPDTTWVVHPEAVRSVVLLQGLRARLLSPWGTFPGHLAVGT